MKRQTTLALTLALPLLACGGDSDETLSFSLVSTCLQYQQPAMRVFRTEAEWQAAYRENGRGPAPAVDFGQVIVAGQFDGPGSACTTFSVEEAVVRDGSIVVAATRHQSTQPCIAIVAYPQVAVQLPRRDEPVRFEIREVRGESTGPARACS